MWVVSEAWPEIGDGMVVIPQITEVAMNVLPWKAALDSSHKLTGRLEWLLVTGLGALDREVIALWSKMREREKEVGTLQDAKAIVQEVTATLVEGATGCKILQNS